MDILIGLVIAMFIITAAYVGFHAADDQPVKEVDGHNTAQELEILSNNDSESLQIIPTSALSKTVI
ncbi:MAG: hypothetical protein ACR2LL_11980 [Nitrosopumilus sp.]|uniref:hypothetical protein n=1 Tax=Nitrosopumilus sp. TaxID=2024843 RepID=UPI00292E5938|nr:hypothetical protein [Nitrosopumilus sp.]